MKTGGLLLIILLVGGCGTTRMTDSSRTATEQHLISHAVDLAVSQLDFRILAGKRVFLEEEYIDKSVVDRGYLISTLRQQILASGCLLQAKKDEAEIVVEARCGGLGTDRHSLLIGVPAMSLPTIIPGQPSQIPEIPFAKKTDQQGLAKLAVYAYERKSGNRIWQSGTLQAQSTAKDLWIIGAGPFQHGSIRSRVTLAGEGLGVPFIHDTEEDGNKAPLTSVTDSRSWIEKDSKLRNEPSRLGIRGLAQILPLGRIEEAATDGKIIRAQHTRASAQGE